MNDRPFSVLFLCTGNSARSILAEQLLNHLGQGRFRAFSAGSHPKGAVHPLALALLREMRLPTDGLRSKGWEEFTAAGAPALDLVITVCDNAAAETCPIWPGGPMTAHWGVEDPASATGPEAGKRRAFRQAFDAIENRVKALASLPVELLERTQLQERTREIGQMRDDVVA